MSVSIDELRDSVTKLRLDGLNTQQIADELSLSQMTIQWLQSNQSESSSEQAGDVRIGWRSIGVRPLRIQALSMIFSDIIDEEIDGEIDTVVGISLNGIMFAQEIAGQLDVEVAIHRNVDGEGNGHLSNKYGNVGGKKIVIVDDVISTGVTMKKTIQVMKDSGAETVLCLVLVNKTTLNEIKGVPLRGIIRAVAV